MHFDLITSALSILSIALVARTLFFAAFSLAHYLRTRNHMDDNSYTPSVSVIVPCYNEELTLSNCVESLLRQKYPHVEIVLVNDGSTDATETVCKNYAATYPHIRAYTKLNGGKASALNYGIARALGEIVVTVDADSVFLPDTLMHLVGGFADASVGAIAGNVKVANRGGILGELQAAEYIIGINMYRRAFAQMGCVPVISGAVGAFRKTAVEAVGGYSSDTLVEDMDITIALSRAGYRVLYEENAVAYTEAPEQLNQLYKQRYRWTMGGFQVLAKYRAMVFNPAYGTMGMISLPYFMLSPFLVISLSALFIATSLYLLVTAGVIVFLSMFLTYVGTQALLLFFAILIDSEDKKLVRTSLLDVFLHSIFYTYITARVWIGYSLKEETTWNPLQRFGKNLALT